jgi:phosphoglucomutase
LSVKGHIPEKDGILACLLMAELVAVERKPLLKILAALEKKTGEFHTNRINVAISPQKREPLLRKLAGGLEKIGTIPVQKFVTTDGYKYLLPNDEWVAFRVSGTEPLIRAYIEAKSPQQMKKLEAACRKILTEV